MIPEISMLLSPFKTEHLNRFGHYERRFDQMPQSNTEDLRLSPPLAVGERGPIGNFAWFILIPPGPRLVSGDHRVQLGLDHLLQLPDSSQVGVLPFLLLPVKNLLAIQVNFESTIRARGERNPHVRPKASKEFVRQPRGGRVELSRHAVQDIHENFPLAISRHGYPPDVPVAS